MYGNDMNIQFTEFVRQQGGTKAVAQRLGCSVEAVQKWAKGDRRPRPDQALAIEKLSEGALPKEQWYWGEDAA
jgi:DNA-binding transcriptional regulator YdaS (Cro superfamily)